ncbi:ArsC/Spx/MgsR family protein [Lactococcus garvieae]|uniref:ArsC/Spx/MgsR family protein n=1 Tax=Lactococcus garvieae TaxID=1363 RepID=UPI00398EA914
MKTQNKVQEIYSLSFNDALRYLQLHPEILRTPIVITPKKILIGFHNEEICQFVPHVQRHPLF